MHKIEATMFGDDTPVDEQVAVLLDDFIYGDPLEEDRQFKQLNPKTNGIWELKTGDVRFFGFFNAFDCFVIVCAADAAWLKEEMTTRYAECIQSAVLFRDSLSLDDPKFIESGDPRYVISN